MNDIPTTAIEKSFCTTREAATLLGVSVGTVQLWVESGLLQAWKTTGGHRRVLRQSVAQLLGKAPGKPPGKPTVAMRTESQPSLSSTLNVMVVEDDADLLRLYQTRLSRWPMKTKVMAMSNAVSALLALGRGGTDLLITDLHMPEMDGFSMLRVLHNAPEMAHTTMVAVTGLDAHAIEARGGVPTGIQVLSKPIPFEQLLAIANGIMNSRSLLHSGQ